MARIILRNGSPRMRQIAGFSLIEVMVAVVVLATGLLALAALQGALARNSADAKARSAVAAALTSRMNEYRQTPPADGTTTYTCVSGNWVCTAQTQGSIDSLTVTDTVTTEVWKTNNFVDVTAGDDLTGALFKRIQMSAQWTDAGGKPKTLTLNSDISAKIYGDGSGYPVNDPTGSAAKYPIVRQDNPSNTEGVIPIVTGNQATAASNPQPIIEGADNNLRVGTSFDVLNYVPEGSTAKITKRFQTEVIKCRCEYGAAGYSVAGKAQWPTVWDGTTYSVYAGSGDAAGVTANAGEDADYSGSSGNGNGNGKKASGREQSEQCTECCRDHHDASGSALEARYDPEASGIGKYNESGGVLTAVSSGKYVAACRVVKVDGLWRTAADMYQRHYGLLETTSVNGVQAKTGIPSSSATAAYQTYVKDFLKLYTGSSTTAPAGAQSMFDETARGLNSPTTITIATADDDDWRYLHGRGLYVDYLTSKAQSAVSKAITSCPTGTDLAECILPVLPFTTINLTEMAKWTASPTGILRINSEKVLDFDVDEPSGGRTVGINGGTANNISVIRTSNSGVAISDSIVGAVDDVGDTNTLNDSQAFTVGGGSGSGSEPYLFKVSSTYASNGSVAKPDLKFTIGATLNKSCTYNSDKAECNTSSVLPTSGTLKFENYYVLSSDSYTVNKSSCTQVGNGNANQAPSSWTVSRDLYTNYAVSTVSGAGNVTSTNVQNNGKKTEYTEVSVDAIPDAASGEITVSFAKEGNVVPATVSSCTYSKSGSAWSVTVVWARSWE